MLSSSVVVILSGGLDSSTLLVHHLDKTKSLTALTFSYGAKHNNAEIQAASALCSHYNVSHHIIDISSVGQILRSSLLLSGPDIPHGNYSSNNIKSTVVPFRNAIMLSIAVGFAESNNCDTVLIGSHAGDRVVYPDCRPEFNKAFNEAARLGTDTQVKLSAPFETMNKHQIAELARCIKDFDISMTYTCYNGKKLHCGICPACLERKAALNYKAGQDPTIYEQ